MNILPHRHEFKTTFQLGFKVVQRCKCKAARSSVFDHDTQEYRWADGNLHDTLSGQITVACLTNDFQEAANKIRNGTTIEGHSVVHLKHPADLGTFDYLYFYQNWWDDEMYFDDSLTNYLNKRMGSEFSPMKVRELEKFTSSK